MPVVEPDHQDPPLTEHERVTRWRWRTLVDAGFHVEDATLLASRGDVDVHQAVKLIDLGCSYTKAMEILL